VNWDLGAPGEGRRDAHAEPIEEAHLGNVPNWIAVRVEAKAGSQADSRRGTAQLWERQATQLATFEPPQLAAGYPDGSSSIVLAQPALETPEPKLATDLGGQLARAVEGSVESSVAAWHECDLRMRDSTATYLAAPRLG
jgi:hypothetical protein